jgi:hypothetical protein
LRPLIGAIVPPSALTREIQFSVFHFGTDHREQDDGCSQNHGPEQSLNLAVPLAREGLRTAAQRPHVPAEVDTSPWENDAPAAGEERTDHYKMRTRDPVFCYAQVQQLAILVR